jgi:hypothetical protein
MSLTINKQMLVKIRFYGVFVTLAAFVWAVQVLAYRNILYAPSTILGTINTSSTVDWSSITVKAMTDINALLTTLGTALLGAVGLLIAKAGNSSKSGHMWAAFLAAVCGGVSLYSGYECHCFILTMVQYSALLGNPAFTGPYENAYLIYKDMQFFALLAGAAFLADFAFHDLGEETAKPTTGEV